ncbi:translation initiation factor IF-2-like [Falco naumanni]|uniref:translation initiation factor IF-2-like n=1 Tax=Falco naumanni TaxID=148594 RepID=UPI001ADE0C50|nr:translation initiation factor IF-2-like [Falco naumanni]
MTVHRMAPTVSSNVLYREVQLENSSKKWPETQKRCRVAAGEVAALPSGAALSLAPVPECGRQWPRPARRVCHGLGQGEEAAAPRCQAGSGGRPRSGRGRPPAGSPGPRPLGLPAYHRPAESRQPPGPAEPPPPGHGRAGRCRAGGTGRAAEAAGRTETARPRRGPSRRHSNREPTGARRRGPGGPMGRREGRWRPLAPEGACRRRRKPGRSAAGVCACAERPPRSESPRPPGSRPRCHRPRQGPRAGGDGRRRVLPPPPRPPRSG